MTYVLLLLDHVIDIYVFIYICTGEPFWDRQYIIRSTRNLLFRPSAPANSLLHYLQRQRSVIQSRKSEALYVSSRVQWRILANAKFARRFQAIGIAITANLDNNIRPLISLHMHHHGELTISACARNYSIVRKGRGEKIGNVNS